MIYQSWLAGNQGRIDGKRNNLSIASHQAQKEQQDQTLHFFMPAALAHHNQLLLKG